MMDIAEKLQIVANLKPGDPLPPEIGPNINWGLAISQLCADALAEIQRLRAPCSAPLEKWTDAPSSMVFDGIIEKGEVLTIKLNPETKPAPEPWGSPYAMNTEN